MRPIHHLVEAPWPAAHDVLCGSPDRWLPRPLRMTGTTHFRGRLQGLVAGIDVAYLVQPPWRDGDIVTRRVVVTPSLPVLGRLELQLVLRRSDDGEALLSYLATTDASGGLLRWIGRPGASLVTRRFAEAVTARFRLAATARPELDE